MSASSLEGFIEEVTGESHLRVEEELGDGFVRLRTSEADRRQAQQDIRCCEDIVLELLRNSRDAGAHLVCVATNREGDLRNIVVIDDGEGIPRTMWDRVFEPRVTSRLETFHADQWGVHGRGMALFSIACNSVEHRIVDSGVQKGAAIRICADTTRTPEKTDQSSLPRFAIDADGRRVVRGPRNIARIVTEFMLGQRGSCLVYLGSPNEVVATLVQLGRKALSAVERAFAGDYDDYAVCLRPALAATPEELAQVAESIGLPISSRSARRILDGQIEPLEPFIRSLELQDKPMSSVQGARKRVSASQVHLEQDDRQALADGLKRAYAPVAQAYYLDADVDPVVRVMRDTITVSIPIVRIDASDE